MLAKTTLLFAAMALSLSAATAFEIDSSSEYSLNDKDIKTGTQSQAGGVTVSSTAYFDAINTTVEPEVEYKSAQFKCDSGLVQNDLICSGNQVISAPSECKLPPKPPFSAAYCNLIPYTNASACYYARTCQGSGTEYFYGKVTTQCPNGFTVSTQGKCQKSTITSAKPFCESGWKLDGYMCSK